MRPRWRHEAMRSWLSAVLLGAAMTSPSGGDAAAAPAKEGKVRVYVGTYTAGTDSKGIYPLLLDTATGALTSAGAPTPSVNPSFVIVHPSGRFLYAVSETGESR